jgi:hemolysin III
VTVSKTDTLGKMTTTATTRYSFGEEIANSVTHGVGWLLSIGGLATLVTFAAISGGTLRILSCAVFGTTLVILYTTSTLYHALPCQRAKNIFRVLDHSAIFVLIAGTYTPLSLVSIGGNWGWSLFAAVWALAIIGVLLNTIAHGRWRWLSIVLYLTMGWLVVIAIRPLVAAVDTRVLVLIVAGGLVYTLGLMFYGWRRLPYGHSVWHIFVLAGSVLHYFAVFFGVGITS